MGTDNTSPDKAMEMIDSPEQLNDYIKVTTPSVFAILVAVLILTAGIIIWSIFGVMTVNTKDGTKTVAPITYVIR